MTKSLRLFFAAWLTITCVSTYAGIDDFVVKDWVSPGDGLITYDPLTNLEWLDVSVTRGNSILDTEAEPYFGEFRWATYDELTTLLNNFKTNPCLDGEFGVFWGSETENVLRFTELFGDSSYPSVFGLTRDDRNGGINAGWAGIGGSVYACPFVVSRSLDHRNTDDGTWLVRKDYTQISISLTNGETQECQMLGGSVVTILAVPKILAGDEIHTITWKLNEVVVGTGASIDVFVPQGVNTVQADIVTVLGDSATDQAVINIVDTNPPLIQAAFLDDKTNVEITESKSAMGVISSFEVSDVCDDNPSVGATTGVHTLNGDKLKPKVDRTDAGLNVTINSGADSVIELSVTAVDASGNTASEKAVLTVTQ